MTGAELKFYKKEMSVPGTKIINSGWPDFLIHRNGEVWAAEVKAGPDKVSKKQQLCHEMLRLAGLKVDIIHYNQKSFRSNHPESMKQEMEDSLEDKWDRLFKIENEHREMINQITTMVRLKIHYDGKIFEALKPTRFFNGEGI